MKMNELINERVPRKKEKNEVEHLIKDMGNLSVDEKLKVFTRAKLIKFIITHIIFKFINCMGMIGMMGMMVRPLETNMQVRIVLFFLKCEI